MSIQPNPTAPSWPAEWQGARITGRFVDFLGAPLVGQVTLTPTAVAVIAGVSKTIIIGSTIAVDLDDNGALDITVPATDDPDTNPTGWTYSVAENFPGGRNYSITAPMNTTRDLTAIVPVPDASGTSITRGLSAYEVAVNNGFVGTEVQWAASLAATVRRTPKVGSWLTAPDIASFTTNSAAVKVSGTGPALHVAVSKTITIDALACYVDTLLAASTIRLGIYATDGDGYATTLLSSVSVSGAATGIVVGTITPLVLTPGHYALVARVSTATTLRLRGVTTTSSRSVGPTLPIAVNSLVGADFGTSAALTPVVSAWVADSSADVALVGMRRSA